jgi:small-conductance mechanosensitive channel
MNDLFDPKVVESVLGAVHDWAFTHVFNVATLVQLAVIAAMFVLAKLAEPRLKGVIERLAGRFAAVRGAGRVIAAFVPVSLPIVWVALLWLTYSAATALGWPGQLLNIAVSLLAAWVVIRLATGLIHHDTWSATIALIAWTLAALNIIGLLGPTIDLLDSIAITFDTFRISVLLVIKGVVALAVLLWAAVFVSGMLERRIEAVTSLTPSIQVLLGKLLKIVLITLAIVVSLNAIGIDLTAFAVFGGALGVGLGFGLQKVVSNLVSGIILLLDKSIKPGDVIAVADTYGWIKSLGARYASVITRDGIEHLIPNEDLITQRVENWSFSNNIVRLKIPVGISYNADVRQAMALCLEAAAVTERALDNPKPVCLLKGFGDSSVDLELRLWINDPSNGVSNVKSEALLGIWDRFHAHGIEIPFPQRDVHIKSGPPGARVAPAAGTTA